jgi:two-component system, chemotaxis family, sensor kinase CheA
MVSKDQDLLRELLQAFNAEAPEHIQTLNQTLLQLERRPDGEQQLALLQEAFRAAHSLKGAARAVGIVSIETLANGVEEVLKQARDQGLLLDPSTCDSLYNAFDLILKLLEGETLDIAPVLEQLISVGVKKSQVVPQTPAPINEETAVQPINVEGEETIRVAISKLNVLMAQASELLAARISADQRLSEIQNVRQQLGQFSRLWHEVKTLNTRTAKNGSGMADAFQHLEEHLHDLNRTADRLGTDMNRDALRLGMVSGRLQDEMRRVRMVPFQTLEPLFQRVVRDAARLEDKQVELRIEGGEIELDKKVLEALKDAFLHLLRNAVSHGIETPQEREAGNKPLSGTILVSIIQRGSEAHISVRDDGRGFDLDRLRESAEMQAIAVSENANDAELIDLAFLPGLSTRLELTSLSGRGVGLDVVRRQIENLQGRLTVENQPEAGSAFHFVVPVSLAMTRVLLVGIDNQRYALPLASVDRIVRPTTTFSIEGQAMISINDAPIPLIPLANILNLPTQPAKDALAVIIGTGEQRIAVLVDDVLTEQELAVKPLSKPIIRVRHLIGVTVLGSGEPVVVLNTTDLMKSARGMRVQPVFRTTLPEVSEQPTAERILVVDDSITTRTLEKNILEAAGYTVYTATDGTRALQQLKAHSISLIVADVEMPNMDGIALTRYLRDTEAYRELPIILVTSLESVEDRERGMVAGANAYIVKRGFNQAELLATIQQFLLR